MYDMGDLENIMLDDVRLKNINDKTHQGIDLIFKNNTPPPEIVIVESKYKNNGKKPRMNKNDVRLKNINDKTHQGIDLIFKNNTPPPEIVIVESKYKNNGKKPRMNKNRNQNTKYKWKRQMDDKWVSKNLEDAVGKDKAEEIREILKQDIDNIDLNEKVEIGNILKMASLVNKKCDVKYFKIGREGQILKN